MVGKPSRAEPYAGWAKALAETVKKPEVGSGE
jgi:hypothetical protein